MRTLLFLIMVSSLLILPSCDSTDDSSSQNKIKTYSSSLKRTGSANNENWVYDIGNKYISASSVLGINASTLVSSVTPSINSSTIPGDTAEGYLDDDSCLSSIGPLGAYGPLGSLGVFNLTYWITAWGSWTDWLDDITGPLSSSGPLGENGPVSFKQYYGVTDPGKTTFEDNDFNAHLRGFGIYTPLGPIGPLGALGPLGPLGPNSGNFYQDSQGNYKTASNGIIIRSTSIFYSESCWHGAVNFIPAVLCLISPYGNWYRQFELYEHYTKSRADSLGYNNDTSFMVTSSLSVKNSHTYKFTSNEDQLVTIVVTPIAELDDFDLYIYDEHGNQLAYSVKTNDYVDWVQIKVPAGKKLQAKVRLYSSGHIFFKSYRIFVTGSTSLLKEVNVTGPHINNW